MLADILRLTDQGSSPIDISEAGDWKSVQDELSGAIMREWVLITDDNPDTPAVEAYSVECVVRSGIVFTGPRQGGTMEDFNKQYMNIEFARMQFPASYVITVRDRITNIRNKNGVVVWRDEEQEHGSFKSTIFNVNGVVPMFDPFGNHVENMAMLERVEV